PAAGNFQASADLVPTWLAESYTINRLDTDRLGYKGVNSQIVNNLHRGGGGVLHYIGHSALTGYGKGRALLSTNDIVELPPASSPFLMVGMACSSAFFGYPPMNSLGETAVLREGGAAVGFLGATGLSKNYLANILAQGFYQSMADLETRRVGDAVIQAKQFYFDVKQGEDRYTLDIYNLLGDSALLIPGRQ
ncbi:MAG: hypothetical protein D3908_12925, partial [Candidatus Electrothrix sp. AUS4]|nr:hypothetical protein [Candidatus Electrothrix sp. AUS4]